MRLCNWLVGALLLVSVPAVMAQYRSTPPTGDPHEYFRGQTSLGLNSFRGLFDPARMHMSHSVQFGVATVGGRSMSEGLYMNRMDYQISKPLGVTTYLGYRFNPSGPAEWNPGVKNGDFVGGADLNWRPSSNTLLRLSVYRGINPDPYYGFYSPYFGLNPYDRRPYFERP